MKLPYTSSWYGKSTSRQKDDFHPNIPPRLKFEHRIVAQTFMHTYATGDIYGAFRKKFHRIKMASIQSMLYIRVKNVCKI